MFSNKELVIFLAGAEAFHTLSHIFLCCMHILPLKLFTITWTKQLNRAAIVINAVITVGLLWWATQL